MCMKNYKEQYQLKTNIHYIVLRTAACYLCLLKLFQKNITVNHLLNGENRRKLKRLPAQRCKNQSTVCNDVIGQNWSRGPCSTPPGLDASEPFFYFFPMMPFGPCPTPPGSRLILSVEYFFGPPTFVY